MKMVEAKKTDMDVIVDARKEASSDRDKMELSLEEQIRVREEKLVVRMVRTTLSLLRRGVKNRDQSLLARAARRLFALRSRALRVMRAMISDAMGGADFDGIYGECLNIYTENADDSSDIGELQLPPLTDASKRVVGPDNVLPEIRLFVIVLGLEFAMDMGASDFVARKTAELVQQLPEDFNRRSLDHFTARVYYYYALSYERTGASARTQSTLLRAHRTACLRHDDPGQIVLTNAILRYYLTFNLISQADKFRLNVSLPDNAPSDELARYRYYIGRINTVQLHYSDAYDSLVEAIRKANDRAVGFSQTANKLLVIVQLLMGEIPERSLFNKLHLKRSLEPYLHLTQAVRVGNLVAFKRSMEEHRATFEADRMQTLIVRLRHNVIKTGLRKLNMSYSRISLADICSKLNLESEESAESIVAKAIHDGVIDATIRRESDGSKSIYSKENSDVYSTSAPQVTLHRRIEFCMDIHHHAVKAMRFPPDAHKPERNKKKVGEEVEEDTAAIVEELLKEDDEEE